MGDHEKGERVLVTGWIREHGHGGYYIASTERRAEAGSAGGHPEIFVMDSRARRIQAHPGVPVELLVKEILELWAAFSVCVPTTIPECWRKALTVAWDLRDNREAANKPDLEPGGEYLVLMRVKGLPANDHEPVTMTPATHGGDGYVLVQRQDIRMEEPG